MKNPSICFALILISSIAFAQQNDSLAINQFRFIDGTVKAITKNGKTKNNYLDCLHLGPIYIGSEKHYVDSLLPNPENGVRMINNKVKYYSYAIGSNKNKVGISENNLLIGFKNNKVVDIFIFGEKPDTSTDVYTFSSLKLGDNVWEIESLLGKPTKVETPKNKGDVWFYDRYPFSFEIVLNKIKSIKIWKP